MTTRPASGSYASKLIDPRWSIKKAGILARDKSRCRHCGTSSKTLQVRHVAHRKLNPWDYPDEELETICVDCIDLRSSTIDQMIVALRIALKDTPNDRLQVAVNNILSAAKLSR